MMVEKIMSRLLALIFLRGTLISLIIGITLIVIALYPETSYLNNGYFFHYALVFFAFGIGIWLAKHSS